MTERDARKAAEDTPELRGVRIRTFGSTRGVRVVLAFGVALVLAALLMTKLALAYAIMFGLVLVLVVVYVRAIGTVRLNNEGVAALIRGDDAVATERFRALAARPAARESVAMALHNLGVVAIRAGRAGSAVRLLRASRAVVEGALFRPRTDAVAGLVAAHLGFALAAEGDLDGAEAELSRLGAGAPPSHLGMTLAYATRAKAFVALRRGNAREAVALLDAERSLLATVLTGNESMFVEAVLAVALDRLGGEYDGKPRPAPVVWVDDEGARFVFTYLPEAKAFLAREDSV